MTNREKLVDAIACGIVELLFAAMGLALLVWALPKCANEPYHWSQWFGLLIGLRLATHKSQSKAKKSTDITAESEGTPTDEADTK